MRSRVAMHLLCHSSVGVVGYAHGNRMNLLLCNAQDVARESLWCAILWEGDAKLREFAGRYGQQMPEGRKQQLRKMVLQHAGGQCISPGTMTLGLNACASMLSSGTDEMAIAKAMADAGQCMWLYVLVPSCIRD